MTDEKKPSPGIHFITYSREDAIKEVTELYKQVELLEAENQKLAEASEELCEALERIQNEDYNSHTDYESRVNYWPKWARNKATKALAKHREKFPKESK